MSSKASSNKGSRVLSPSSAANKGGRSFSLLGKAKNEKTGARRLMPFVNRRVSAKKEQLRQSQGQQQSLLQKASTSSNNQNQPPIPSVAFSDDRAEDGTNARVGGTTDGNVTDTSRVSSLTDRDGLNLMAARRQQQQPASDSSTDHSTNGKARANGQEILETHSRSSSKAGGIKIFDKQTTMPQMGASAAGASHIRRTSRGPEELEGLGHIPAGASHIRRTSRGPEEVEALAHIPKITKAQSLTSSAQDQDIPSGNKPTAFATSLPPQVLQSDHPQLTQQQGQSQVLPPAALATQLPPLAPPPPPPPPVEPTQALANPLSSSVNTGKSKKVPFDTVKALLNRVTSTRNGTEPDEEVQGEITQRNVVSPPPEPPMSQQGTPRRANKARDPTPFEATTTKDPTPLASSKPGHQLPSFLQTPSLSASAVPQAAGNMAVSQSNTAAPSENPFLSMASMLAHRPPTPRRASGSAANQQQQTQKKQQQRAAAAAAAALRADPPTSPPAVARQSIDAPEDFSQDDENDEQVFSDQENDHDDNVVKSPRPKGIPSHGLDHLLVNANHTMEETGSVPMVEEENIETAKSMDSDNFPEQFTFQLRGAKARDVPDDAISLGNDEQIANVEKGENLTSLTQKVEEQLNKVVDLCSSPTTQEEDNKPQAVGLDPDPSKEKDDKSSSSSTRNRRRSTSRSKRHRELVAAGDGSMRDRILQHTASSKAKTKSPIPPTSQKSKKNSRGLLSPTVGGSPNDEPSSPKLVAPLSPKEPPVSPPDGKNDSSENEDAFAHDSEMDAIEYDEKRVASNKKPKRRRRISLPAPKSKNDVRAKISKKASAMAKKHAQKSKEFSPAEAKAIAREALRSSTKRVPKESDGQVTLPDEISCSQYEIVSDLDQSMKHFPLNTIEAEGSEASVSALEVPVTYNHSEVKSSERRDRYSALDEAREKEIKEKPMDRYGMPGEDDSKALSDEITEWAEGNQEEGQEGIEMVFKERAKSVDWDIASKAEESLALPQKPDLFCGTGALLHALALDEPQQKAQATKLKESGKSVDTKLAQTFAPKVKQNKEEALDEPKMIPPNTQPKDPSAKTRYNEHTTLSIDTSTQSAEHEVRESSRPKKSVSLSQSNDSSDKQLQKTRLTVIRSQETSSISDSARDEAVEEIKEAASGEERRDPDSISSSQNGQKEHVSSSSQSNDSKSLNISSAKKPQLNEMASFGLDPEELSLGNAQTSSQWTDIKPGETNLYEENNTDPNRLQREEPSGMKGSLKSNSSKKPGKQNKQSIDCDEEKDQPVGASGRSVGSKTSAKSGASKVKVLTEFGETTLLLTPASKAGLKARAAASNAKRAEEQPQKPQGDNDEPELIDLTAIGSFEDLGIDEAVWLFDVSPRSSTDQDLWVPKSTDLDSVMDLAVARLKAGTDNYHTDEEFSSVEIPKPSTTVKDVLAYASKLVRSETSDSGMTPLFPNFAKQGQEQNNMNSISSPTSVQKSHTVSATESAPVVVVVQGKDIGPIQSTVVDMNNPNKQMEPQPIATEKEFANLAGLSVPKLGHSDNEDNSRPKSFQFPLGEEQDQLPSPKSSFGQPDSPIDAETYQHSQHDIGHFTTPNEKPFVSPPKRRQPTPDFTPNQSESNPSGYGPPEARQNHWGKHSRVRPSPEMLHQNVYLQQNQLTSETQPSFDSKFQKPYNGLGPTASAGDHPLENVHPDSLGHVSESTGSETKESSHLDVQEGEVGEQETTGIQSSAYISPVSQSDRLEETDETNMLAQGVHKLELPSQSTFDEQEKLQNSNPEVKGENKQIFGKHSGLQLGQSSGTKMDEDPHCFSPGPDHDFGSSSKERHETPGVFSSTTDYDETNPKSSSAETSSRSSQTLTSSEPSLQVPSHVQVSTQTIAKRRDLLDIIFDGAESLVCGQNATTAEMMMSPRFFMHTKSPNALLPHEQLTSPSEVGSHFTGPHQAHENDALDCVFEGTEKVICGDDKKLNQQEHTGQEVPKDALDYYGEAVEATVCPQDKETATHQPMSGDRSSPPPFSSLDTESSSVASAVSSQHPETMTSGASNEKQRARSTSLFDGGDSRSRSSPQVKSLLGPENKLSRCVSLPSMKDFQTSEQQESLLQVKSEGILDQISSPRLKKKLVTSASFDNVEALPSNSRKILGDEGIDQEAEMVEHSQSPPLSKTESLQDDSIDLLETKSSETKDPQKQKLSAESDSSQVTVSDKEPKHEILINKPKPFGRNETPVTQASGSSETEQNSSVEEETANTTEQTHNPNTDHNVDEILKHPKFEAALERYLMNKGVSIQPSASNFDETSASSRGVSHILRTTSPIDKAKQRKDPPIGGEKDPYFSRGQDPPSHDISSSHVTESGEATTIQAETSCSGSAISTDMDILCVPNDSEKMVVKPVADLNGNSTSETENDLDLGEDDASPPSWIEETDEGVEVRVDNDSSSEDKSLLVPLPPASDPDDMAGRNTACPPVNSLLASSVDSSKEKETGATLVKPSSNPEKEMAVALEDGFDNLCAFPLDDFFPNGEIRPKGSGSRKTVKVNPPEILLVPTDPSALQLSADGDETLAARASTEAEATSSPSAENTKEANAERKQVTDDTAEKKEVSDGTQDSSSHDGKTADSLVMSDFGDEHASPSKNAAEAADSLVMSDFGDESAVGTDSILGTTSKAAMSEDSSNLLLSLTRSEFSESHPGPGEIQLNQFIKKMDRSKNEKERAEAFSRVEKVRAMLEANSTPSQPASLSSIQPSSALGSQRNQVMSYNVPGSIQVQSGDKSAKFQRSPRLQSVLERLKQRRGPIVDAGPVDPDDLFSQYTSITKNMVVNDSSRLERVHQQKRRESVKEKQNIIDVSDLTQGTELDNPREMASLLDKDDTSHQTSNRANSLTSNHISESSAPVLGRTGSFGSTSDYSVTPSEKARDLRKQLDQALMTSVAIRGTQERLSAEISTFKNKLQNQREVVRNEAIIAMNPNSPQEGSPHSAYNKSPLSPPRSPQQLMLSLSSNPSSHTSPTSLGDVTVQASNMSPVTSTNSSTVPANRSSTLHHPILSPIPSSDGGEETTDYFTETGGETSGSETDEDDVRLQHLDSIIHGLRDAQRRQVNKH